MLKDRIFRWGLKRRLARLQPDDIMLTPDAIVIPLQFVEKPVVLPVRFETPGWLSVIRLMIEEVLCCSR